MIGTRSSFINTGMPSLCAWSVRTARHSGSKHESSCSELGHGADNDQWLERSPAPGSSNKLRRARRLLSPVFRAIEVPPPVALVTVTPTAVFRSVSKSSKSGRLARQNQVPRFLDLLRLPRLSIRLPSEIAHADKKVLRTFLRHVSGLRRIQGQQIINHMPAFHVICELAICYPLCSQ